MTTTIDIRELRELRGQVERAERTVYTRYYQITGGKTPADVALDAGQALPDVAAAEIVSVEEAEAKVRGKDGEWVMVPANTVKVTAEEVAVWE